MLALALCLAPAVLSGIVFGPRASSCFAGAAQDGAATSRRAPSTDEIQETLAEVRFALQLSHEARVGDDLDEARLHLSGALEVMQALDGVRARALLPVLAELDGTAERLGELAIQVRAREWVLAIRAAYLPADHADRLLAQESLGIARYFQREKSGRATCNQRARKSSGSSRGMRTESGLR